jgi:predicted dehydrogenase
MAGGVRVGLLGAAKIAPLVIISRAQANPDFSVVAVAARDSSRARAYAAKHNIPDVAEDYAALIARDDIDLVYHALPPSAHAHWTIAALDAGKHVLCEKPFAMTANEARAMVAAAERNRRHLIEAFHYRFHNVMARAIEVIRSGELGKLVEAEGLFDGVVPYDPEQLRWLPDQGGGALMDQGCYLIHGLRTLSGSEPRVVRASATMEHGVDAAIEADLMFDNGMKAHIATRMTAKDFRANLVIGGDKGSMRIANPFAPQLGCKFTVTVDGVARDEPVSGPSTYAAQFAHVADVLLRGAKPITGGADAIANMAAIDAIYAAAGVR